jgi:hypothetical protein
MSGRIDREKPGTGMRRVVVAGVVGIVAFGAAAALLVWRSEPAAIAVAPPEVAVPPPAPLPPPPEAVTAAPVAAAPATARPKVDPRPVRREVPAMPDRPGVGRMEGNPADLFKGLRPYRERVSACAAREFPAGQSGTVTLSLQLETLDGRVRVSGVDAPGLGSRAGGVAACARSQLVGQEIPVAMATAGRSYTMPYPIRY